MKVTPQFKTYVSRDEFNALEARVAALEKIVFSDRSKSKNISKSK